MKSSKVSHLLGLDHGLGPLRKHVGSAQTCGQAPVILEGIDPMSVAHGRLLRVYQVPVGTQGTLGHSEALCDGVRKHRG